MSAPRANKVELFQAKMKSAGLAPLVIGTFSNYYEQLHSGETGFIRNADIRPILPQDIPLFEELEAYREHGRAIAERAVMIRLNGGLGTSMGLSGPKSLLPVKNGHSFLSIILGQAARQGLTLALMNSFSTQAATLTALKKLGPQHQPLLFLQNKFPKIDQDHLTPVKWPQNEHLEWNPPGHGDVFTALSASGMLSDLIARGIQFAFIANSDNLGASLDTGLLGYMAHNDFPFMMEVAEKTLSDIKGGHIARRLDGRLVLRESAQCPQDELDAFKDIGRYRYFNTNNIWVDLKQLDTLIEKKGAIHLPIIINPKTVDPRDKTSPPVYQLETAMGAAISLFDHATAVRVPRSRFLPVKKSNDLMAVRSDCFVMDSNFRLYANPERSLQSIQIKLDKLFFQKIDDFDARFSKGIPSLLECKSLLVEGDVAFGSDVVLKGDVVIKNHDRLQMVIPAGSIIDNEQIM